MNEIQIPQMDESEARERIERVRGHIAAAWADLIDLYDGRAWTTLGYDSWDDLCTAEFDGARIQLPRDDRRDAVMQLRDAGLSTRAIGSAIGTSDATVRRDLDATATNDAVDPPTTNVGLDGRRRTNTPNRPESEPVEGTPWFTKEGATAALNRATEEINKAAAAEPGPRTSTMPATIDEARELFAWSCALDIVMRCKDIELVIIESGFAAEEGAVERIYDRAYDELTRPRIDEYEAA